MKGEVQDVELDIIANGLPSWLSHKAEGSLTGGGLETPADLSRWHLGGGCTMPPDKHREHLRMLFGLGQRR